MPTPDERTIDLALGAVARIMKMFWAERAIYLAAATAGMVLLLYAAFLMISAERYDEKFLGLVFGSGGLLSVAGGGILLLLNRTFGLVREIILARRDNDSGSAK